MNVDDRPTTTIRWYAFWYLTSRGGYERGRRDLPFHVAQHIITFVQRTPRQQYQLDKELLENWNDRESVMRLVRQGAKATLYTKGIKWTALMYAVERCCYQSTWWMLLNLSAKEIAYRSASDGWSALHVAAHKGYFRIVTMLVKRMDKNDLGLLNNAFDTALILAARNRHVRCAALLVSHMTKEDLAIKSRRQGPTWRGVLEARGIRRLPTLSDAHGH